MPLDPAFQNAQLDACFGDHHASTFPDDMWLALFYADDIEADYGGYARCAVTNDSTSFPDADGGLKSNGVALNFPTPTTDSSDFVAWKLVTAAVGGDVIASDVFAEPVQADAGEPVLIDVGALVFAATT